MAELNDKLISFGNLSYFQEKLLNNEAISDKSTWSSEKINAELEALAGDANSEIVAAETIDITFVDTVPSEPGTDGQYVVYVQEAQDTLYKYENAAWSIQTADANKLYFDTEHDQLYSYVSATHKFMPVAVDNTIIFSGSITSNAAKTALNPIKTPGVYNVLQHQTSSGKTKMTNWVMTVTYLDSDEADEAEGSVYQKLENNYTVYKRYYKPTTDTWTTMTRYYEGLVRDSLTSSAYYSWSVNKIKSAIAAAIAEVPQLEAGENISVEDGKINANGYKFDDVPVSSFEPIEYMGMDMAPTISGAAGATTYTVGSDQSSQYFLMAIQYRLFPLDSIYKTADGKQGKLVSIDNQNGTITFEATLDANNAISDVKLATYQTDEIRRYSFAEGTATKEELVVMGTDFGCFLTGAAGATTYSYTEAALSVVNSMIGLLPPGTVLELVDGRQAKFVSVDGKHNTITVESSFDDENAISNVQLKYFYPVNMATGMYSHAEGGYLESEVKFWVPTLASGAGSHAEGAGAMATGPDSHAEGQCTLASGIGSHAEGICMSLNSLERTIASGDGSHAEGVATKAQNLGEHAEGNFNASHKASDTYGNAGNTTHSVGIGTGRSNKKNALEIMQNGDHYIIGLGGYQGTDTKVQNASIKTVQDVVNGKQDTLTAGDNIVISNNVISAYVATNNEIDILFN